MFLLLLCYHYYCVVAVSSFLAFIEMKVLKMLGVFFSTLRAHLCVYARREGAVRHGTSSSATRLSKVAPHPAGGPAGGFITARVRTEGESGRGDEHAVGGMEGWSDGGREGGGVLMIRR